MSHLNDYARSLGREDQRGAPRLDASHRRDSGAILVRAEYEPKTGKYQTNQLGTCDIRLSDHALEQSDDNNPDQTASGNLENLSDNAISSLSGTLERVDYLISCLFYLNVFMSILNTLLLSLLVKSVQLSGHNLLLKNEGLVWNEHTESMHLEMPAHLKGDRLLSVGIIQSNHNKPLIIENVNTLPGLEFAGALGDSQRPSRHKKVVPGQILISAQSESSPDAANYIQLPAGPPTSSSRTRDAITRTSKRPVEIVTSSLILNQFDGGGAGSEEQRSVVTSRESRNASMSPSYNVHVQSDQLKRPNGMGATTMQMSGGKRRSLELDGHSQTIVLPFLNKINVFSPGAKTLFVSNQLKCNSGISGRLDDNFDIQTRWGNLIFRSGRALRIVSRSSKLDLASARSLSLEAPTLRMSATQTNKVLISSGIEFFESEHHRHHHAHHLQVADEQLTAGQTALSTSKRPFRMEGFRLVLVNDILMATQD